MKEIEAEEADENKDEEAARAWAEEAVIETDDDTGEDGEETGLFGSEAGGVEVAEIFFNEGVDGNGDHQNEDDRFESFATQVSDGARAEI